jgi:hypothetical protein
MPPGPNLGALIADAQAIGEDARRQFGGLPAAAIERQPAPGAWSAGQCLQHLIRSNTAYVPAFESIARGDYRPPLAARLPLLPRLWGRLIFRAVRPETTRRTRTPARFDPRPDAVDAEILTTFLDAQARLIDLMRHLRDAGAARVCVVSPFSGFVAYSVLDACRIIVAHERRHLAQAARAVRAV